MVYLYYEGGVVGSWGSVAAGLVKQLGLGTDLNTRQAIVIVNTIYMRLYEYRGSAGAIALATFGFSRSRSRGVGWIEPGFSRVPHKMNLAEPGDKVP